MPTFATKAINYFTQLKSPVKLPTGIQILNPYENAEIQSVVEAFFKKYYNDTRKRVFILGINPGRFGGGLTGISFTDPVALRNYCGIENKMGTREELSSKFIYKVIDKFGGVNKFFSDFYLSAIYSLALIKDGKNHNYYDSQKLFLALKSRLKESLENQFTFGAKSSVVICLGKKNADYLKILDDELNLFDRIEILDHPRFIMQYKLKKVNDYISKYLDVLSSAIN